MFSFNSQSFFSMDTKPKSEKKEVAIVNKPLQKIREKSLKSASPIKVPVTSQTDQLEATTVATPLLRPSHINETINV